MIRALALGARLTVMLALVASTQGLLFVQGAFALNQDWVIENLCVNRDRPELHCDGHCVLSDRMHEEQEREDQQNSTNMTIALSVTALVAEVDSVPQDLEREAAPVTVRVLVADDSGTPLDVFRPPRAA